MKCPKCRLDPVPEGSKFCPNCGEGLEMRRRLDIHVQAASNLGNLIGVQTSTLNGDVYGQNVIYVLSESSRLAGSAAFFQRGSPPYKALAAYTARDQPIFKGREDETEKLLGRIGEQPVVVLYGASGVGKTSLLAAGVVPRIVEAGALAIHLRDYSRPVSESIRAGLAAGAQAIAIALPPEATLPGLLRSVQAGLKGTLVLILDHAEKFFTPGGAQEDGGALAAALADSLEQLGPDFLRVIFAIDEQQAFHLEAWRDRLPDMLRGGVHLLQLSTSQARAAIIEPLGRLNDAFHYDVGFDDRLVDEVMLRDLDELTPKTPGLIFPPHLQIVCDRLYREARDRSLREIGTGLYVEQLQAADGILSTYFRERFTLLADQQRPAARKALVKLARPDAPEWNPPEALADETLPADQRTQMLDSLEAGGLLISRPVNSHREYALTSPALADSVRLYLGDLDASGYDPLAELARLWSAWLATGDLPGEAQILRLEGSRARCEHSAAQALLLMRAAAAHNLPAAPWLEWFQSSPDAAGLVSRLEGIQPPPGSKPIPTISHLDKAANILALKTLEPPEGGFSGKDFGQLAWAAARSPAAPIRQAAAQALLALEGGAGLNRLENALWQGLRPPARGARKAELRGALADADPAQEQLNRRLPPLERARIHLWRAGRRMNADRQRLAWLCLGGGVGAGLGLGLLRGLSAALTQLTVGLHAFMNFGFGFWLGAALVFGMLLAEYLRLKRPASGQAALLSTLLGCAGFGLAGVIVALASGSFSLAGKELVTAAGFAAGLILALGLYPFPWQSRLRGWPLRLLGAGAGFALIHLAFVARGIEDISAAIIWPGAVYRAELARYELLPVWSSLQARPGWYNGVAAADAFLTGAVLCGGILLSFQVTAGMIRRWQNLTAGLSAREREA